MHGKVHATASREGRAMRHVKAIAVLLAMLPASAMAGNEAPKFSDEQMACLATATKEYLTTNAEFVLRATGKGTTIMSVDDTIAQRRWLRASASDGLLAFRATSRMTACERLSCGARLRVV